MNAKAYVGEYNTRGASKPVPKTDGYAARMDEAKAYHRDKIISMLDECSPEDLPAILAAVQAKIEEVSDSEVEVMEGEVPSREAEGRA